MPYLSRSRTGEPQTVFCYVRVSSEDQAHGASLSEQRRIIHEFCTRKGLAVRRDIEDVESAAKAGRTGFTELVKRLSKGEADGVVFHKVDRSSRNFRDWVMISDLMDAGHYIAFASEGLDSADPGGRLTMDILAATAVHFIRNLRSEVLKGNLGRMRDGYWPRNAPAGYLNPPPGSDRSHRCLKSIDPIQGPIIRELFELYASGVYTMDALTAKAKELGLRSPSGALRTRSRIGKMLDNPFYAGFVPYKGELFPGRHEAIVPPALFEAVQRLRKERTHPHRFVAAPRYAYQRLCRCGHCGRVLVPETKKGRLVYYRCHTKGHPPVCIREERLDDITTTDIARARLSPKERLVVLEAIERMYGDEDRLAAQAKARLQLELNETRAGLDRLTRSLMAGVVEESNYVPLKSEALVKIKRLEQQLAGDVLMPSRPTTERVTTVLDSLEAARSIHEKEKRRTLLQSMYSNFVVIDKNISTQPRRWLSILLDRARDEGCRPPGAKSRTATWPAEWVQALEDEPSAEELPRPGWPRQLASHRPNCIKQHAQLSIDP